jgi:hypothetical protein
MQPRKPADKEAPMPIDIIFTPAHERAQHQRPWPSPTVVLVEPRPGEWC